MSTEIAGSLETGVKVVLLLVVAALAVSCACGGLAGWAVGYLQ